MRNFKNKTKRICAVCIATMVISSCFTACGGQTEKIPNNKLSGSSAESAVNEGRTQENTEITFNESSKTTLEDNSKSSESSKTTLENSSKGSESSKTTLENSSKSSESSKATSEGSSISTENSKVFLEESSKNEISIENSINNGLTDLPESPAEDFKFQIMAYHGYGVITRYLGDSEIVVIPNMIDGNPVNMLADSSFYGRVTLTNVLIPDSVFMIGNGAFQDCTSLTNVSISNGLQSITSRAFKGCTSLKSITIPDSVTVIDSQAFSGCTYLTIHGKAGSEAEKYAKENNIDFVAE